MISIVDFVYSRPIFSAVIAVIPLSWFYHWIRMVILSYKLPMFKCNPFITFVLLVRAVSKNRNFPHLYYILEGLCALCVLFEHERLGALWTSFRPVVFLFKPETVEVVLNSTTAIDKSREYKFLHPWLGTGLLTSTGDKWRARRKLLTPTFHFRILDDFVPIYNEQSQVLVSKLKQLSNKEWIDIVPTITMCTLDIICETTMGVHVNAQRNPNNEYVKAIYDFGDLFMYRAARPWLWFDKLFYLFPSGREFRKDLNIVHSFTRKVIKERKAILLGEKRRCSIPKGEANGEITHRSRKAFLELLLELHFENPSFTEEDIREEVDTFMFEGHDTTAMAISWTLYNVGLYPEIQESISQELDYIFAGDKERPVTTDDIKAMKYLDCVVKESLRLFPSVPAIAREIKEDIKLSKYTIPSGCTCLVFPLMLHRDRESFPNPEKFDPDRFLPENSAGRHPYAYIPFSAGPRNCIGQRFAAMEERAVLANIFRHFKVKSLDPRDRIHIMFGLVLRNVNPLRIQITPR